MLAAPAAIPPNPKIAAIIASTTNITVQRNIIYDFKFNMCSVVFPTYTTKDELITWARLTRYNMFLTHSPWRRRKHALYELLFHSLKPVLEDFVDILQSNVIQSMAVNKKVAVIQSNRLKIPPIKRK